MFKLTQIYDLRSSGFPATQEKQGKILFAFPDGKIRDSVENVKYQGNLGKFKNFNIREFFPMDLPVN